MLRFLAPRLPQRTPRLSYEDIKLDGGLSRIQFNNVAEDDKVNPSASRFLVINCLPPAPGPPLNIDSPNSSLCPPYHIHLKEDETFRVISGHAKFLLLDRRGYTATTKKARTQDGITRVTVPSGETITIPRGQIHTFRNASTTTPLTLEFGFTRPSSNSTVTTASLNAKMRQFFLNTQLYRSDCAAQRILRVLSQVLLFNHHADVALVPGWMVGVYGRVNGMRGVVERLAGAVGRIMNVVGGVMLGRLVYGLRGSYGEYCPDTAGGELVSNDDVASQGQMSKSGSVDRKEKDQTISESQRARDRAPEWACQAWRDHSFDGQDDSWRK